MIIRKLFLLLLVLNINLPIILSFVNTLNVSSGKTSVVSPIDCAEEESKEDADSFEKEKEKNIHSIDYNIAPFITCLEKGAYFFNDFKTINRNSEGPYTPPELS